MLFVRNLDIFSNNINTFLTYFLLTLRKFSLIIGSLVTRDLAILWHTKFSESILKIIISNGRKLKHFNTSKKPFGDTEIKNSRHLRVASVTSFVRGPVVRTCIWIQVTAFFVLDFSSMLMKSYLARLCFVYFVYFWYLWKLSETTETFTSRVNL